MSIEYFQKIADLLLKGVGATAIAAGGLYVSLNKNRLDQGSVCLSMSEKLYAQSDSTMTLERMQKRMALLIERYNDACDTLSDSEISFLMNSIGPPSADVGAHPTDDPRIVGHGADTGEADQRQTNEADVGTVGWVAIGKVNGSYGQVNFDGAEVLLQRPLPQTVGQQLKARWTVNVRENTSNTKDGKNPIHSVLEAGSCIKSGELADVRGQVWTFASVVNCD